MLILTDFVVMLKGGTLVKPVGFYSFVFYSGMTILLMAMSLLACSLHMLCGAFQLLSANLCNLGYFHFYAVCSLVEIWSWKKGANPIYATFYAYISNGTKFRQGVGITI
jgi:hypothetical protein